MNTSPTLSLLPLGNYDFACARTYFTRRVGELVDRVEAGSYRRLFEFEEGAMLASLQPAGDGSRHLLLSCTASAGFADGIPPATVSTVAGILQRTLGLNERQDEAHSRLSQDPAMAVLVQRHSGLRLVSTPTPFEAFVWAVLGQQISLQVAFKLKTALVQRCGRRAEVGGRSYWSFPRLEAVAGIDPVELAALGLGHRKAGTIVDAARAILDGSLDLDALADLSLDEAESRLVALHGVGPWTAQYVLLRGLRQEDACPISDMGLRVACGSLYELGRKATAAEVEGFAERWRPYRGTAAFFLWFMLTDRLSSGGG